MLMSIGGVVFFEHRLLEEPALAVDSTDRPPGEAAFSILVGTSPEFAEDRAPVADAPRPLRPPATLLISSVVSGFISAVDWLSDSLSNCL